MALPLPSLIPVPQKRPSNWVAKSNPQEAKRYPSRPTAARPKSYIFADQAISGATDGRAGLQRLLTVAKEKPAGFSVLLVDDTSRLSRKLSDALRIKERLDFAGIRVIFVSQGFDSSAPQSQTLLTVHGLVDGLYLEGLREKTFRGVEQLALTGLHTGGRVFGYRHVPIESATELDSYGRPVIHGVRLQVDPTKHRQSGESLSATPPAIR
jgi:DNA invertase Pin-like site-specific DNA recombinase